MATNWAALLPAFLLLQGIPVLVSPDDWDKWNLKEGAVLEDIEAHWIPMPGEWTSRFPTIREIPKGVLRLKKARNRGDQRTYQYIPFCHHGVRPGRYCLV